MGAKIRTNRKQLPTKSERTNNILILLFTEQNTYAIYILKQYLQENKLESKRTHNLHQHHRVKSSHHEQPPHQIWRYEQIRAQIYRRRFHKDTKWAKEHMEGSSYLIFEKY